jgi:hypothetical protein
MSEREDREPAGIGVSTGEEKVETVGSESPGPRLFSEMTEAREGAEPSQGEGESESAGFVVARAVEV